MRSKRKVGLGHGAVQPHLGWAAALLVVAACQEGSSTSGSDSAVMVSDGSAADAQADAEDDDAGPDEADAQVEAEAGGDVAADAGSDAAEAAADAQPTDDAARACKVDSDCDDKRVCNGVERCVKDEASGQLACAPGQAPKCTFEHPCSEETKGCDCRTPDVDRDNAVAIICGGDDCDDSRAHCNRSGKEECDLLNLDEDCNPETFNKRDNADGDSDSDGYVDVQCKNFDEDAGVWHGGNDCNDRNRSINPMASEVCDYFDNNCNGWVDERLIGSGVPEEKNGGLMSNFLPDFDRDGRGKLGVEPVLYCEFTQPPGYVEIDQQRDCDDARADVYEGAQETCDGRDNDCDGLVDAADPDLLKLYETTNITCVDGGLVILPEDCPADRLWCEGRDLVGDGCRTLATRLSSCRACRTDCQFACGKKGCDDVTQIAAGADHACARSSEGRVACWGRGQFGRLGNDGTNSVATPEPLAGILDDVRRVASGGEHSCAIAGATGALYCWGNNSVGQLGNFDSVQLGTFSSRYVQVTRGATTLVGVTTPLLSTVVDVAAGSFHTCVVLANGAAACWGQQRFGRLGNGEVDERSIPAPQLVTNELWDNVGNAVAVTLGENHSCLLTNEGKVECWGNNSEGQLGRDPQTLPMSEVTLEVPGLANVTQIAAGQFHTCALSEGKVYCWGANDRLQLGRSTDGTNPGYAPRAIDGLTAVTKLASGSLHSCALGGDKRVRCWGFNDQGQLGSPNLASTATPVTVSLEQVRDVSLGGRFSCAVTDANKAFCWGFNELGALGVGQQSAPRTAPTQIHSLSGSEP